MAAQIPDLASLLSTAGDLVFVGTSEGLFLAVDTRTGRQLWQFRTGSGIHSNPVTYSVNGKQYVAVPTGWGGWIKGFAQYVRARAGKHLVARLCNVKIL